MDPRVFRSWRRPTTDARRPARDDPRCEVSRESTTRKRRAEVVIAGGGFAALEAAIALRALAGDRVHLTLVSPSSSFVYRPAATWDALAEAPRSRYDLGEIAADLGIGLSTLRRWIDKRREQEIEAPPPERREDLAAELKRLRRENEILRQEREILKRAATFFAKEGSR